MTRVRGRRAASGHGEMRSRLEVFTVRVSCVSSLHIVAHSPAPSTFWEKNRMVVCVCVHENVREHLPGEGGMGGWLTWQWVTFAFLQAETWTLWFRVSGSSSCFPQLHLRWPPAQFEGPDEVHGCTDLLGDCKGGSCVFHSFRFGRAELRKVVSYWLQVCGVMRCTCTCRVVD